MNSSPPHTLLFSKQQGLLSNKSQQKRSPESVPSNWLLWSYDHRLCVRKEKVRIIVHPEKTMKKHCKMVSFQFGHGENNTNSHHIHFFFNKRRVNKKRPL